MYTYVLIWSSIQLKKTTHITDFIFTTDICFFLQKAKPPKEQTSENFVLARRQREQELLEYADFLKLHNQCRRVHEWQQRNEQKWLHSAVQRKVDVTMREYLAGTDERRER